MRSSCPPHSTHQMINMKTAHKLLNVSAAVVAASLTMGSMNAWAQADNFGFPFGFSTEKMDLKADPRTDFKRYAAGRWLDAAKIPSDSVRTSNIDVLIKRVEGQVQSVLDDALRDSAGAARGTPAQQVGDFYASGMDEKRLTELGVAPIKPDLDRISAINSKKTMAEALAHLALITNDAIMVGASVSTDTADRGRYMVYVVDGDLPMGIDNYLSPEKQKIRDGYLKRVTDSLVLAGSTPEDAARTATKVLEIETRVAGKKLTPLENRDPSKRFVKMRYDDLKAKLKNIDLDTFLKGVNLPASGEVIVMDLKAMQERDAMLAELPLEDIKAYLRWDLLRRSTAYLTPAFLGPNKAFTEVMYGKIDLPPRNRLVAEEVSSKLGHPLGQLYVTKYFSPETRKAAEDLVVAIKTEFRRRIEKNQWLAPQTRQEALKKLDAMKVSVGYPKDWIDYTQVEIKRDDYYGNMSRINTFRSRRELARIGQPVKVDGFAIAGSTQPTDINAAYQPSTNSIEIPAAFLQNPFYDPKGDAAVNYCALGAVVGHEFTHGFDSMGRLYDAKGNLRDWWTASDAKYFASETQKLVKQASAIEVLPGLHINGELSVGENLADVGGVGLASAALERYLRVHPSKRSKIDGLNQPQRCYLSWGQLWADKANDGYLRQVLPVDGHPPGIYRMASPAQHDAGFYKAFRIRAGDPLWLAPKSRVAIW